MGVGKRERQTDRERRDRIQVIIFGKPIYLFINEGTLKYHAPTLILLSTKITTFSIFTVSVIDTEYHILSSLF